MYPFDEENTSFITDRGLYYYKMMSFELKNTGATYQRLVNKIFVDLIGKTMKVYVDDMLEVQDEAQPPQVHFWHCLWQVSRYMINQRGIEANPEKINALLGMGSPQKTKEVQSLTGRVATLGRFVSKATDKCLPFFKAGPFLSKPKPGDILQLYLAISNEVINIVLIREEGATQLPTTSKVILSPETRYPDMEKLALSLITASRKLRPYFHAHTIHVLTNFPLRQVLQKPDASGKLLKWAVELSEFDIVFKIRVAIKGQALANFVAEFANVPKVEEVMEPVEPPTWNLFVDGLAGDTGLGAGVFLVSPEGLRLAKEMQVRRLRINSDSQLVISQVKGSFSARDKTMASYLKIVMNLLPSFEKFEVMQILRLENTRTDALSKLASSRDSKLLAVVPIEHILMPSTETSEVLRVEGAPTWMQSIIAYLKDHVLPTDKDEAYKLREEVSSFPLR
ncbi:uncharacterized protein LOC111406405 [Olea europaea var. sylvestris]|uniref:uncharacterized protein LOC111406405 n=1 Tax=Olea europaea var. sylvestris TaxID=158386 RepID=UPI000C1D251E|nr:uncharacterized protein LOC111406405 [Olea europaea var. sylvestris]